MKRNTIISLLVLVSVILLSSGSALAGQDNKIPITTTSNKALDDYLKGRDLSEKLRGEDSRQHYEDAVALDPNFAMAYVGLALVESSAKGYFEKFDKAVALLEKVSEGEQQIILGMQAANNGDPMLQRKHFKKLVKLHPQDERAHNYLGNHYFGQQEYDLAIEEYNQAITINPSFSPTYNQLGYSYRFIGNYTQAEKAFKKYINLIPEDPNPYDSYAELLMKMGNYDESIKNYKKALTLDPNFIASHVGIANNLNYKGKHRNARKQLMEMFKVARNDGERRAAYYAMTVSYVDEGNIDKALETMDRQYTLAEKISDAANMSADLNLMGNLLFEKGRYTEAQTKYDKATEVMVKSDLSKQVKNITKRNHLYNTARVAMKTGDFTTATTKATEYQTQVQTINSRLQIMRSHELMGMIALEQNDFNTAITELKQANQQNPYNLYRIALAYDGLGDITNAKEMFTQAAKYNSLNSINYSLIRNKAQTTVADY
jgi:tetratricopeptide (TPR) repeat protein